jgi:hypothetical protein
MNPQRFSLAGALMATGGIASRGESVASPQDHSQHFLGYTIEHKNLPEKRRSFWQAARKMVFDAHSP